MSAPAPEQHPNCFRLILACLAALTASLPMAWISLAKFFSSLVYLIADHFKKRVDNSLAHLLSAPTMLAILKAFSLISIIFNSMNIDKMPSHFYALTCLCLGWFEWPDDATREVST